MKVLIAISDSFCANFIKGQARYLKNLGHEVVIVSGPGVEIDNLERNESVKIIRVDFAREISPWNDLKALFKVINIVRREKPDIINAGNPKTGFLFSLAHILFWKTPLIFTLRGIRSDTLVGLKKKVVKATEFISCLFSNKVISISPSLKTHAVDIGIVSSEKCIVLSEGSSNGIDVDFYKLNDNIIKEKNNLRKESCISEDSFIVSFVGRVTRDKGIIELIDAINICISKGANLKLIIAGPIEKQDPLPNMYYEELENNKDIIFLGKQIDVRPIYALSDALVLYSYREGFGNVVIEASSFAVPTIVADIPGLRDTTKDNITGLVVKPKNAEELSKAIMKLYNDREYSINLGENGQCRIREKFANEIIWDAQCKLYLELCKSL